MIDRVRQLIDHLELTPHPEGGFYKETYRSEGSIPAEALPDFSGSRSFCTAIYFMLTHEHFSAFHRIKQDELWHFYEGSPLYVHVISPSGEYTRHELGLGLEQGQQPQLMVPAGAWFASSVKDAEGYSLVGCTVSPGFDFHDFELADRASIISLFPQHKTVLTTYTR